MSHRSRFTRVSVAEAVLAAALLVVPVVGAGDTASAQIGTSRQPLVVGGKLWTQNASTIPMCWHSLNGFATTAESNAAMAFVSETIQEGWINPLKLTISWVNCPTTGDARHVRVMLRKGDASYNGTTLQAGMATLSTAKDRLSPPPNDPPGLLMGFRADWNTNLDTRASFRSLILHEFGHVLGFDHEFTRPDGVGPCYTAPVQGATTLGPADPRSIMAWSYCRNTVGALTPDDMRAARSAYGIGNRATNDFNDDGRADVLWYNSSTGETQIWFMGVSSRIGRATVTDETGKSIPIGPPWRIAGSRDFNGDGKTDILWYNSTSGESQIWMMNGSRIASRATVVDETGKFIPIGPPWQIVTTGDTNGDGFGDIIWHNQTSNETQVWQMQGGRILMRRTVTDEMGRAALIGPPWSIVAADDMNGDRRVDLVWYNSQTGETQIWQLAGTQIAGRITVVDETGKPIFIGPPWRIASASDFNLDGRGDVLWYNAQTGESQMWMTDGRAIRRRVTVDASLDGGGHLIGPPWSIMRH